MIPEHNFCRVFEMPEKYPEGYLFSGGKSVDVKMVDWFNPWPDSIGGKVPETWAEVAEGVRSWLLEKKYLKPGRRYVLVTEFGEALVFDIPRADAPTAGAP